MMSTNFRLDIRRIEKFTTHENDFSGFEVKLTPRQWEWYLERKENFWVVVDFVFDGKMILSDVVVRQYEFLGRSIFVTIPPAQNKTDTVINSQIINLMRFHHAEYVQSGYKANK